MVDAPVRAFPRGSERTVVEGLVAGGWLLTVLLAAGIANQLQEILLVIGGLVLWTVHLLADRRQGIGDRHVSAYAGALVCWWMLTWLRTIALGVPAYQAFAFGRDFLLFALLLPPLPGVVARHRAAARYAVAVLALGALGYVGLLVAANFGHVDVAPLVPGLHLSVRSGGGSSVRIYSPMNDLVALGFAMSTAAAWQAKRLWQRLSCWALTATFAIGVLLQQTRATYFGLAAGVVVGIVLWRSPDSAGWTNSRARVLRSILFFPVVLAILVVADRGVVSLYWHRAISAVSDFGNPASDASLRLRLDGQMMSVLGAQSPVRTY